MDYIEAIEEILGRKAIKEMLPMQPGDVPITNADISDLINDYNYTPATGMKEGVEKFIAWYRSFYNV